MHCCLCIRHEHLAVSQLGASTLDYLLTHVSWEQVLGWGQYILQYVSTYFFRFQGVFLFILEEH